MSIVKNAFYLAFIAALAAGSYYILTKSPCDTPITYHIGAFDPKFGVSKADFLADVNEAQAIWDKALGKELFKYDPNGEMPINLVYDNRQAMVDTAKTLTSQIDTTVASADQIKADFLSLKSRYQSAKAAYDAAAQAFESALSAYNQEVAYWNAKGGAPAGEYDKLQSEQASLEGLRADANAKMLEANDLARQVNAMVDKYNSLVGVANQAADKINQNAGKEFEEGEYISDSQGIRINVYEFDGKAKLVRLLAHELGHSLGMDHNANPNSIMYYLNSGTSLAPTADDIAALKKVCRVK